MIDALTADIFLFIRTRVKIASNLHQHLLPNSACISTKDDALAKIDALLERIVRSSQLHCAIFTKSSIAETNRTTTAKRKQTKNCGLLKSIHILRTEMPQFTKRRRSSTKDIFYQRIFTLLTIFIILPRLSDAATFFYGATQHGTDIPPGSSAESTSSMSSKIHNGARLNEQELKSIYTFCNYLPILEKTGRVAKSNESREICDKLLVMLQPMFNRREHDEPNQTDVQISALAKKKLEAATNTASGGSSTSIIRRHHSLSKRTSMRNTSEDNLQIEAIAIIV